MNKDADLSRNINKDSIIYQHEQSMRISYDTGTIQQSRVD